MTDTVEGRKAAYLQTLRETGSHARARAAAGVGTRAVGLWRDKDEPFAEAEVEAAEYALDTVVQRSRQAAMEGDSAQLTNWMRLARPELRPANTVQVGVQVGVEERRRRALEAMTDEELLDRARRVMHDAEMRAVGLPRPRGDAIDAEVLARPQGRGRDRP